MPDYPKAMTDMDFLDPESGSGRFAARPAIAIGTGEHDETTSADKVIRDEVGEWILEEAPELGTAEPIGGSIGRGAEGWIAVVQWVGDALANNVFDIAVGYALARVMARLRKWKASREAEGKHGNFYVSRGAAAALAGAAVAEEFDEAGPLEVEAVEEPSSIAGWTVSELSYVGLEPWIVLLRNMNAEVRYVVVVLPDGSIAGQLRIPFLEFEAMFLRESRFEQATRGREQ
jgi:hypothetical protein